MFKIVMAVMCLAVSGCAAKVGSQKWCDNLVATPKGDWTFNETKDYAKYCIFRRPGEQ